MMKSAMVACGILLILIGIISFAYRGFSYTQTEKLAEIGSVQVTADVQKTVVLSPIFGGISIVAGIFLVVMGRIK